MYNMGASGFDRIVVTLRCEPWILVGHVKSEKKITANNNFAFAA